MMLNFVGAFTDVLQKHGKIVGTSVIVALLVSWNVPIIRDGILTVIGVGTHAQQMKNAEGVLENKQKFEEVSKTLTSIRHFQLQSLITNEVLPLELRMSAYDDYTKLGYNSWVHLYYEKEILPLVTDMMSVRLARLKKEKEKEKEK